MTEGEKTAILVLLGALAGEGILLLVCYDRRGCYTPSCHE